MTDPDYFDRVYADAADPWRLATDAYENRKYDTTLAALGRERYRRAFEPGCSVGVLTARLAERCDQLVAWDRSAVAVEQARRRAPSAEVTVGAVPGEWPTGEFDLVVLSELVYYLDAAARGLLLERAVGCLVDGGEVLAVHWSHPFDEAATDGPTVHRELRATPGLEPVATHVDPDFGLDLLRRVAAPTTSRPSPG
ncbi:class I SAM-dependent methyltransferase [Solicola sp. PLA-1-18]|uniref:class I SAM-dependent methyltransferase n=1 Tax=Solicola sp. PLA-1-18 TaxID=3380532 RepID=UPI003B7DAECD